MLSKEHDPEKWVPAFGKRSCSAKSVIPKSGYRLSEKDHAQMQIKHANRDAIVTIAAAALRAVQIRRAKCPR